MTDTSPTSSPATFTPFVNLPFEIRLKIWKWIAPGPRNVRIEYNMQSTTHNEKQVSKFTGWTSKEPVPVILHICQESRVEGLKTLELAFGSYFHNSKLYFDFSRDALVFGDGSGEEQPDNYLLDMFIGGGYHGANDYEKVRRMACDIMEVNYNRKTFIWDEIRDFSSLEALTLYLWEDESSITVHECMRYYRSALQKMARIRPEWKVPQITVITTPGRHIVGTLEVRDVNGEED